LESFPEQVEQRGLLDPHLLEDKWVDLLPHGLLDDLGEQLFAHDEFGFGRRYLRQDCARCRSWLFSVARGLNAHPEVVLLHPVAANGTENCAHHMGLAFAQASNYEAGCLRQLRLFSRGFHVSSSFKC